MAEPRCTFASDEHALQLAYFERHLADRAGHRGRGFQLRPEHRHDGLLDEIREPAKALPIQWHPFIGHGRSSQACCVNFLMPMANRPALLARWLKALLGEVAREMLPIEAEAGAHRHVAFEYTGPGGIDYLGEAGGRTPPRGANATAADAAIGFADSAGQRQLLLIEWKYTEQYRHHRLSDDPNGTRIARYAGKAFAPGGPLRSDLGLTLTDFFHEPFYQLLRQQMLARQIETLGGFDRVRVLHLSPAANRALHRITAPRLKRVGGIERTDAFDAYRATLADPESFLQRSIEQAFAPLAGWADACWYAALAERYPSLCPAR